jgi:hypothetical protein
MANQRKPLEPGTILVFKSRFHKESKDPTHAGRGVLPDGTEVEVAGWANSHDREGRALENPYLKLVVKQPRENSYTPPSDNKRVMSGDDFF